MSDEPARTTGGTDGPTLAQVLATIQDVASTTASMRAEFVEALAGVSLGLSGQIGELAERQSEFVEALSGVSLGLSGQIGELAERQSRFFTELGKTRSELMDRMQTVRDDVTVNLAAARIAEQAGRGALEQGNVLADALAALTRQVRQLQDRVDALQDGKPNA